MAPVRGAVLWVVCAIGGGVAGAVEVTVDCDAGGVLAQAVSRVGGGAVVHVLGTCAGPVEVTADGVTLRGVSSAVSAIEGVGGAGRPAAAVVAARGVRDLRIEKLRLADGPRGVDAVRAEVTLEDCDLARTDTAIVAHDATLTLTRTTLRDSRMGLDARRSRVDVGFGEIHGVSDVGVAATEFSEVVLFRTRVQSDGMSVANSTLVATLCELEGSLHARAYSRVSLAGARGSNAALRGSLQASNSEVFVFRLPIEGTVRVADAGLLTTVGADLGPVLLSDATHARLTAANVAGDVRAGGFSWVQLSSTTVAGELVCERASDAICEQSAVASVSGCPSCVPVRGY